MVQKEYNQFVFVEICPDEALAILHSVSGLLMLVERHKNHPDTPRYLNLISTSLLRLEGQIKTSKTKPKL